jgi:hypothetical protein
VKNTMGILMEIKSVNCIKLKRPIDIDFSSPTTWKIFPFTFPSVSFTNVS